VREKNSCALVWEGMVKHRNFAQIIFKSCPTVTFAREYLKRHNCEHYWDSAQSDAIIELSEF
jgi:U4/U6 small nuclear ribonucleoprotein PRP3